jgi:hypothetical protein
MSGRSLSRLDVHDLVSKTKSNLPPVKNTEKFRALANGFFQSEGSISARIRGLQISPIFTITHNLTPVSLVFFLQLCEQMKGLVYLTFVVNLHGN